MKGSRLMDGLNSNIIQPGAENVYSIGDYRKMNSFNLSTAAGWTMLYWWGSVAIILLTLWLL